jgi:ketosteroid isomerase-like protein
MRAAAILFGFTLCACAVAPQGGENVRAAIERQNANAERWYASGDIDSLASVFAVDAWQMPPNSPPLVGREAIRGFWSNAVKWGKWQFAIQTQEVSVSGPMAVERGKYNLRFTAGPAAPPGMSSFEDHGNYLVHWRRDPDGAWRVVGDAPVSDMPR